MVSPDKSCYRKEDNLPVLWRLGLRSLTWHSYYILLVRALKGPSPGEAAAFDVRSSMCPQGSKDCGGTSVETSNHRSFSPASLWFLSWLSWLSAFFLLAALKILFLALMFFNLIMKPQAIDFIYLAWDACASLFERYKSFFSVLENLNHGLFRYCALSSLFSSFGTLILSFLGSLM